LLLGLKGTMSEAELHVLRARLIGGMLNKARRGELQMRIPIGFVYDATGHVVLDPDQQVQQTIRVFFDTFRRTGSATATVKRFRAEGLSFPRRYWHGPRKGEVVWGRLTIPARCGRYIIRATPERLSTGGPTSAKSIESIASAPRRSG
jgi:DNA invertase Pin-like site-specific DNA recombinase